MNIDFYMELAIKQAKKAKKLDEVPIGAILVDQLNDEIISARHNETNSQNNPLKHAELLVIEDAFNLNRDKYLVNSVIFSTLEPCVFCASAITDTMNMRGVALQDNHYFTTETLVTHKTSNCDLYDQLQGAPDDMSNAGIKSIHLIGDAHTPSVIAQATFSGTRLAREFDSDNPDQHKPFIRERRLLNATEKDYQLDAETLLVKPYH